MHLPEEWQQLGPGRPLSDGWEAPEAHPMLSLPRAGPGRLPVVPKAPLSPGGCSQAEPPYSFCQELRKQGDIYFPIFQSKVVSSVTGKRER